MRRFQRACRVRIPSRDTLEKLTMSSSISRMIQHSKHNKTIILSSLFSIVPIKSTVSFAKESPLLENSGPQSWKPHTDTIETMNPSPKEATATSTMKECLSNQSSDAPSLVNERIKQNHKLSPKEKIKLSLADKKRKLARSPILVNAGAAKLPSKKKSQAASSKKPPQNRRKRKEWSAKVSKSCHRSPVSSREEVLFDSDADTSQTHFDPPPGEPVSCSSRQGAQRSST